MQILVGSDHAGYELKEAVKVHLESQGHQVQDVGAFSTESCDYPQPAAQVARGLAQGQAERGILVCGSGEGMCITANRFKGVRGIVAPSLEHARLGRAHNDANLLCLGERLTPLELALQIVDVFISQEFEGGRHARRLAQIEQLSGG